MSQFHYTALTASGESVRGRMEAASADEVVARLQDQGLLPVTTAAGEGDLVEGFGWRRSPFPAEQQRAFLQQLAILLGAGQPLDRALATLMEQPEHPAAQSILANIREIVRGGQPLSVALELQHGVFPRMIVQLVRAGEASGQLQPALARLAESLEQAAALRAQVISAMIYPAILMAMVGVALAVLLGVVVPQFHELLTGLDLDLPWYSTLVLSGGMWVRDYAWLWMGAILLASGLGAWQWRQPATRAVLDAWLLRQRRLGSLVVRLETARFARTLGTLLGNGVPMLPSLGLAAQVLGNRVLVDAVQRASEDVKAGQGLALALGRGRVFPKLALQMVQVGEEAGELGSMLLRVADTYDAETRQALQRLLAALVPVITILLAAVVALVVMAVLVPLYDLTNLAGA